MFRYNLIFDLSLALSIIFCKKSFFNLKTCMVENCGQKLSYCHNIRLTRPKAAFGL